MVAASADTLLFESNTVINTHHKNTAAPTNYTIAHNYVIGKMRNCGIWKVKCGIQICGNVCRMLGKMWNAES